MEIRKLSAEDASVYRELRIEALINDGDAFGASIEDTLNAPLSKTADRLSGEHAMTFGAFLDDKLVGNVTLSREKGAKYEHRASVYAVYVTPDARGKGVANNLMQKLIDAASEMKEVEQLHLAVSTGNAPALALYESFGFKKYGVEVHAMKTEGRYIDEELMVKFL